MSEQITVTVKNTDNGKADGEVRLKHRKGEPLLDTLREGGIHLPSLCGTMGKCGRCQVRFHEGAPLPTQLERSRISPSRLRQGYRLACAARPMADCVIETVFPEEDNLPILTQFCRKASEQTGKSASLPAVSSDMLDRRTVVAADLGTTTIAMQLIEVSTGAVKERFTCLNPQRSFGADVISRIHAAEQGKAARLKEAVESALAHGIEQLCGFAESEKLCKPEFLAVAANTAMGHLFMGYPAAGLGKSPFTPVNIGRTERVFCGMKTVLLPGISAFVGGDIVSGLYACGLGMSDLHKEDFGRPEEEEEKAESPWLFVDLGTNAEMVIGCGKKLFCTAAAAGSAFEGGAFREKDGFEAGTGTGAARIRALAELLAQGAADETGLLGEPWFTEGITVNGIHMTQSDIRELQTAKAAVRAGIHFLKEKAGLSGYGEIERVYLAGGFGFFLDPHAAVCIGLIPQELEDRIVAAGNASIAGANLYALETARGEETDKAPEELAKRAEAFNLAQQPDFDKRYIGYMNFDRPLFSRYENR